MTLNVGLLALEYLHARAMFEIERQRIAFVSGQPLVIRRAMAWQTHETITDYTTALETWISDLEARCAPWDSNNPSN